MKGHQIAGTSLDRQRIENDFYATPIGSVLELLKKETIVFPALEPACGNGAISKSVAILGEVWSSDLIDRGYGCKDIDFLSDKFVENMVNLGFPIRQVKTIITNPPFNLFQEFAETALSFMVEWNVKKVILFGKLQALEGQKRATFMENSPLRTVYVFKSRQNPLRNGLPVDEKGKPWASTMAFAWYVWEKGYTGKPTIEWI